MTSDGGEDDTGDTVYDGDEPVAIRDEDGDGEDDTEDVMSEVMSIPDSETLKDISEALYDDVKAEYVNELDDKAHDTLHAAIHYISVFYQVVRQREKHGEGGVRGRQEIEEKREEIEEKILEEPNPTRSSQYAARLAAKQGCLEWVLGEVDDL